MSATDDSWVTSVSETTANDFEYSYESITP